ncbi:GNAT family N-acetyltransferase [Congregibacter litoralis]|nr:GNAT family N-acetyltransferase [Congregibacter litoralis]
MSISYGLETRYLIAENCADKRIRGIFPAARVPGFFGAGRYCSLPYCDRGEPLADNETIRQLLLAATDDSEAASHEIRDTLDQPAKESQSGAYHPPEGCKVRMVLALPNSASELEAGFKSKLRSQIRKSEKNGLTADTGSNVERVSEFFAVYAQNMRNLGSPAHSKQWFESIAKSYGSSCSIGIVRLEGSPVGAGIVLRAGAKVAIPWASTLKEFNSLSPNMLLYWTLLAEAADSGATSFDFGRSTMGEGTFRFKKQWGAIPEPLNWTTVLNETTHTLPANSVTTIGSGKARRVVEKIWRHLPVSIATTLGATVRPYISL